MMNHMNGWMGGRRNAALAGARRTGSGCADRGDWKAVQKIIMCSLPATKIKGTPC
jgi:hypothetical protein